MSGDEAASHTALDEGTERPLWHLYLVFAGATVCIACLGFLSTGVIAITAGTFVTLAGSLAGGLMVGLLAGVTAAVSSVLLLNRLTNRARA